MGRLVDALYQRMDDYVRTGDASILLEERVRSDAESLQRTAVPALSPTGVGPCDHEAVYVLAWYHFLCSLARPDDPGEDFALALFLFDASDAGEEGLPETLVPALGDDPDPHAQVHAATMVVRLSLPGPYAAPIADALVDRARARLKDGSVELGTCLGDLGYAYKERFDRSGEITDLRRAIDRSEQALVAAPEDAETRAAPLFNLVGMYGERFTRLADPADLDRAVARGEQAVPLLRGNWYEARALAALAGTHRRRAGVVGEDSDVDAWVDLSERAARISPADDPRRPEHLAGRFDALVHRYRHAPRPGDLDAAITSGEEALAAQPDYPALLSTLVHVYEERYARSAGDTDIRRAVVLAERAVDVADDPSARARCLSNLGLVHQLAYTTGGRVADIDAAIRYGARAVAHDGPDRPDQLSTLATSHLRRLAGLGDQRDLDAAIEHLEDTVGTPDAEPADLAKWRSNLGVAYRERYARLGALADLQAGNDLAELALEVATDDDVRALRLNNVAIGFADLYDRTHSLDDLQQAVDYAEQALAAAPDGHPDRRMYLGNLASLRRQRFDGSYDQEVSDLDRAVECGEEAIAIAPDGHPAQPTDFSNLGAAYGSRFLLSGSSADLDAALDRCRRAVAVAPHGHPRRGLCVSNMAVVSEIAVRSMYDDPAAARDVALQLMESATGLENSPPVSQVNVARETARLLSRVGMNAEAARVGREAVEALRRVAPRELGRSDREDLLDGHPGLVADVVAAHLDAGDASGAMEVAESGRGILLGTMLDLRTEPEVLRDRAPDLVDEFRGLQRALASDTTSTAAEDVRRRRDLVGRWDRLLTEIRTRPGLDHFLGPLRAEDLRQAGNEGAVVVVSVSRTRTDAVVLRPDGITGLRIPGVTAGNVQDQVRRLTSVTGTAAWAGSLGRQRAVPPVLAWLWDHFAGPVLDLLGHRRAPGPDASWPRVWWVPTGVAGMLPLHAAGRSDGDVVLDRVVSSYAPTVRALLHSRGRPSACTRTQATVTVSDAIGHPALPGSAAEAHALRGDATGTVLADRDATAEKVLAALSRSTWAHIACHSMNSPTDSSQCGLMLADGLLEAARISDLRPAAAELAYLSACSTADHGGRRADEVTNVASAFQLAGFRHVIGTLWPVDDAVAAQAARRFYDLLPDSPRADHAPFALHRLAREMREQHPDRPDLWAPFVHIGV